MSAQNIYATNPNSGRMILKSSVLYKKLVKSGVIKEESTQPPVQPRETPAQAPQPVSNGELKVEAMPRPEDLYKTRLLHEARDAVLQNSAKLADASGMNDQQLDALLKKLLMAKLGVGVEPKGQHKKSKKRTKKARFKVVSSSESEDSSDESD